MIEIRALRRVAKEVGAFMKALQSSPSFHEERVKLYQNVMSHYFNNCDPNKSVEDSKSSVFRFRLDQFTPNTQSSSNHNFQLLETVSFPPLKVRHTLKILKCSNQRSPKNTLKVDLELVNLRPYQDNFGKTLLCQHGSARKARARLGAHIKNTIIISWDTSEDDIFVQLLILASKNSCVSDSHEAMRCFLEYARHLKEMSYIRDSKIREEIASSAFGHIVRCYGFPVEEYSFKKYISSVIYGIKKGLHLPKLRVVKSRFWRKPDEESDSMAEIEITPTNIDDFQIFEDDNGLVTYGVDRVSIDTGISRDTIYRYIRQKKIHSILVHQGIKSYRTLDDKMIANLKSGVVVKKELVKWISKKRAISKDSARRRIARLRSKGLTSKNIFQLHR